MITVASSKLSRAKASLAEIESEAVVPVSSGPMPSVRKTYGRKQTGIFDVP
jgi:hypothetical protein